MAKSRKEAARAARTHQRVYVTGCGANLAGDAFAGLPDNVVVVARRSEETPEFVAGDVGAIGCVQADARLDRVRAFVKVQDGCSFGCRFCVIPLVRGASRSRRRGRARRDPPPRRPGTPRGGAHRDQPRLLPRPYRRLPPAAARAGGRRDSGLERLRLSSIEINHVDDELVRALRETPTASRHLHVPLQSGDDGVLKAMGRRYSTRTTCGDSSRSGGVQPDERRHRRLPGRGRARVREARSRRRRAGLTKVHVFPYSPRPGTGTAAEDPVPPQVKKERSARLRGLRTRVPRALALEARPRRPGLVDRPGRGTATTTPPGSCRSRHRSASSSAFAPAGLGGGNPRRMTERLPLLQALSRRRPRRRRPRASSRSATSTRRRPCTSSSCPSATSTRSARSATSPPRGGEADARVRRRGRSTRGLDRLPCRGQRGPSAGQTVFHLHWHIKGGWGL